MRRAALILALVLACTWAGTAGATSWHRTGASVFGQPCDPGEVVGYRGDPIAQRPDGTYPNPLTFAELGMAERLILGVSDNVPPDCSLARLERIRERVEAFGPVPAR